MTNLPFPGGPLVDQPKGGSDGDIVDLSPGAGGVVIPRGVHSTSGATISHYRPALNTRNLTTLLDETVNNVDFTLDSRIGWWDFGGQYLANIASSPGGGNGSRLYVPNAAADSLIQPSAKADRKLTIAASFYFFDRGNGMQSAGNGCYLFNHCVSGGFNQEYALAFDNNFQLYVGRDTAGGWDAQGLGAQITELIPMGQWFHIIYTQNATGTGGAVWLNGNKATYTNTVTNQSDNSARTNIGFEQADRGTFAVFNPIYEDAECSDARAAELYADHDYGTL